MVELYADSNNVSEVLRKRGINLVDVLPIELKGLVDKRTVISSNCGFIKQAAEKLNLSQFEIDQIFKEAGCVPNIPQKRY